VAILPVPGTCEDGIWSLGEDRIDCGGPCPACQCTDDVGCDNADHCDGVETCDAYGNCAAGTPPCGLGEWCSSTAASCMPYGNGDYDGDGDVDLYDGFGMQSCFAGSAEVVAACAALNMAGDDGTIDLVDFALFETLLSTSGPQ
jgi:hypothetical protein